MQWNFIFFSSFLIRVFSLPFTKSQKRRAKRHARAKRENIFNMQSTKTALHIIITQPSALDLQFFSAFFHRLTVLHLRIYLVSIFRPFQPVRRCTNVLTEEWILTRTKQIAKNKLLHRMKSVTFWIFSLEWCDLVVAANVCVSVNVCLYTLKVGNRRTKEEEEEGNKSQESKRQLFAWQRRNVFQ